MSPQGYPPPLIPIPTTPDPEPAERPRTPSRLWLHALLFALTIVTTAMVGAGLSRSFAQNRPLDYESDLLAYTELLHHPAMLLEGLNFALVLLLILMAHEMGHYLACVYYGVDASLPYFIPAPTLIGTMGAFIRIRSPIFSRRALFDIGIAGPLAGFVFIVPALIVGMIFSKLSPGIGVRGDFLYGTPLLIRLMELVFFPGVANTDIHLHPVARAAWAGLLATALNLLPIGQLDGGHIVYGILGERHRFLSITAIFALVPLGFLWPYWWGWALILFLIGRRHPTIYDTSDIGQARRLLALVAFAVFVLSFTVVPVMMDR